MDAFVELKRLGGLVIECGQVIMSFLLSFQPD